MNATRLLPNCIPYAELPGTVDKLLLEALYEVGDQRIAERRPFIKRVNVTFDGCEVFQRSACFSRDISNDGIGLLHYKPMKLGDAVITIFSQLLGTIHMSCRIEWCRSCGDGWYTAGARFVDRTGGNASLPALGDRVRKLAT